VHLAAITKSHWAAHHIVGPIIAHQSAQEKGFGYASNVVDGAQARYVVVCRGPHCRERGALPLRKRLVELLRGEPSTRLVGYQCFGQCDFGPNVAFFPEGEWFGGLIAGTAAERVVEHATLGQPLDAIPLTLPEPERSEHLRNIGELVSTLERDRLRGRRWWWPF
jgi:(2Fe-2S) ferredoxin